ncbi:MAG TPA: hypothetical protein VGU68_03835 [Ktedonobacteraceae bacterium]|nr:hypothetical protein [Ktedonobacteraceae bacterium]
MIPDSTVTQQLTPYLPWMIIAAVFVLFILLRFTRKGLRRRVEEIGYRLFGDKGLLVWFWLNAPGVILHEMSHAIAVLLFSPFGFRITSVTFFRIKPTVQRDVRGQVVRRGNRQSLQLGEVQYVRPEGRFMSYVGDGLSGVAPLFGGIAAFIFLYWVATGYNVWDLASGVNQHLQLMRPGWPLWTLIFAPYLILTVTSELWPSSQDWKGARRFVVGLIGVLLLVALAFWYFHHINKAELLTVGTFVASRINFALLVLLALDIVFLIVAELLVRALRR